MRELRTKTYETDWMMSYGNQVRMHRWTNEQMPETQHRRRGQHLATWLLCTFVTIHVHCRKPYKCAHILVRTLGEVDLFFSLITKICLSYFS